MSQEQFIALMPFIVEDLVNCICKHENIAVEDAIQKLYSSMLYSLLEQEDTKLWHYSTKMLYALLRQEQQHGTIEFPDI